jgi:glycerophosphoryl diester phosphodiesterase
MFVSKMKIPFVLFILTLSLNPMTASEPLIVAHRGASKDAPENTIPSFELAWKQGADAIEGDFYLSKDGHIVCIHDKNTKKLADKEWIVPETSFADLRLLDVGAHHSPKYKGTMIPTIAEVFATIPAGKSIYIEVKCGKEIVPTLLKEIEKSGLNDDQIVVIAFDEEVIREIKLQAPQFKANWLSGFEKNWYGKIFPSTQSVLKTLKDIDADGFSSSNKHITRKYISTILEAGYEYHVWTVDDPIQAEQFRDWGALSITTNVPSEIRTHFHE